MNEPRPRIGIPVPTSRDHEYNQRSWRQYGDAVVAAGGQPGELPLDLSPQELLRLAAECAGFVLPGSPADLDPAHYGQDRHPSTAPVDGLREQADRLLLEHAEETGKPVLGICFGIQSMNVWRGGTLVQDLQPVPVNHGAGGKVAVAHSVLVTGQSLLGGLLGAREAPADGVYRRLMVNSSHHQAVGTPGDGFTVVARCGEDGVVEAMEGRVGRAAVLGVQWHPERSTEISAASRALFAWVVAEASDLANDCGELLDVQSH